jgi:hypothetical protein
MKKLTTATTNEIEKLQGLTRLDLGDRSSHYCVLDETGRILVESNVSTSPNAMKGGVWVDGAESHRSRDRLPCRKT